MADFHDFDVFLRSGHAGKGARLRGLEFRGRDKESVLAVTELGLMHGSGGTPKPPPCCCE